VFYKNELVLTGIRDEATGLWKVPINPIRDNKSILPHLDLYSPHHTEEQLHHLAANVYTLPFKQQQLKYMHQSFFNPPIHTLIKAIRNGQLEGIPFMKADLVRKYLAPSPATLKGCMKRPRTGIRSTRTKVKAPTNAVEETAVLDSLINVIPMEEKEDSACHVFCYAALADKHTGTMYTDATGALPVVTLEGHQYYFVAYAYDPNYIFAIPLRNVKDESILEAFVSRDWEMSLQKLLVSSILGSGSDELTKFMSIESALTTT
jgi:hypothetical protein